MHLANATGFASAEIPHLDPAGWESVTVVLKATFDLTPDGRLRRSEAPSPIRWVDELFDANAPHSSVRLPSDVEVAKHGVDVLVVGDAIAAKATVTQDVAIRIGSRTVVYRVHGERVFERGLLAAPIGPAAPFLRAPMVWELAYGGTAADYSVVEERNPVGRGVARSHHDLAGKPAPRIEHPASPHHSSADRHAPHNCAPIPPHWSPRKERFGTMDERWRLMRMPLPPLDQQPQYASQAPDELHFPDGLKAGAEIAVQGMSERLFRAELPDVRAVLVARYDEGQQRRELRVDSVVIRPEDRRIELAMRGRVRIGRRNKLRELRADALR